MQWFARVIEFYEQDVSNPFLVWWFWELHDPYSFQVLQGVVAAAVGSIMLKMAKRRK